MIPYCYSWYPLHNIEYTDEELDQHLRSALYLVTFSLFKYFRSLQIVKTGCSKDKQSNSRVSLLLTENASHQ